MWPGTPQRLDAGPRGGGGTEVLSALSTGGKKQIAFFKGDEAGTPIGSHTLYDLAQQTQKSGDGISVGMVQTWNQCNDLILTSQDKPDGMLVMDTETGQTKNELALKRQQANWKMTVDSVTPMQKFEQYKPSQEYQLFGLGDGGQTVFALSHDTRVGENVEQYVIRADAHRKYKSKWVFTCHAQTKSGHLVLGRSDGAVALYDAIMKSENASCVIDEMPGPVSSVDVTADGSMVVWTTPQFAFCTCPSQGNWLKGKATKPKVLQLGFSDADQAKLKEHIHNEDGEVCVWTPIKFDATTAKDADGLSEREIISYCGQVQVRWNVRQARAAWAALNEGEEAQATIDGVATVVEGAVTSHMTVMDDMDLVALGDGVRGLKF